MSDKDNKGKKPLKSVLPAQSSAQDTSNWDDKAFTTPQAKKGSSRDFIFHELKRDKSEQGFYIRAPKDYKPDSDPKKNKSKD